MNTVYTNKRVIARKEYDDYCRDKLDIGILKITDGKDGINIDEAKKLGLTDEDISVIQDACNKGFKILKGELHRHLTGRYDGELYDVRLSIPISDILTKHDLWFEG